VSGAQIEALKTVVGVATLVLAQFRTSIQDDVDLLRGEEATPQAVPLDLRQAVRFRLEKKKLLNQFLQHLAGAIKVRCCSAPFLPPYPRREGGI
jgi:Rubisco LSMT substrate-binding